MGLKQSMTEPLSAAAQFLLRCSFFDDQALIMSQNIVLTGITTTGIPHLGNYAGAIRPAIAASQQAEVQSYFFLADQHALIKCQEPERIRQSAKAIAATWLACGLDPAKVRFYRQSDIPEIMELNWILTCVTAKGLMNRAHAYKAAVQANLDEEGNDPDKGISMGLFNYPILMAADILIFNASRVPVGKDQIQHIEMCRDIAARFNYLYGDTFQLPEAVVSQDSMILPGLDGRKMSKSYNNTIPLFDDEKSLRKLINKIVTNSLQPGEPKDADSCAVFALYSAFADNTQIASLRAEYQAGIGWGEAKKRLFELLNEQLQAPRAEYQRLMASPDYIEQQLQLGAKQARQQAIELLNRVKQAVGLGPIR